MRHSQCGHLGGAEPIVKPTFKGRFLFRREGPREISGMGLGPKVNNEACYEVIMNQNLLVPLDSSKWVVDRRRLVTKIALLAFVGVIVLTASLVLFLRADNSLAQNPQIREAPRAFLPPGPPPIINGHGTGYIPPPVDLSHLTGQRMPDPP